MSLEDVFRSKLIVLTIRKLPEFGEIAETLKGESFVVKKIHYKNTGRRYYGREVYVIRGDKQKEREDF